MTDLLTAVKAALIAAGYRAAVVPDPDAVLQRLQPPFITIADGGYEQSRDGLNESTGLLTVIISIYWPSADAERAMLGSGHRLGIAAMATAIHTLLDDNLLALSDYEDAVPQPEKPTEIWGDPDNPEYVRKQLSIRYSRVETD